MMEKLSDIISIDNNLFQTFYFIPSIAAENSNRTGWNLKWYS